MIASVNTGQPGSDSSLPLRVNTKHSEGTLSIERKPKKSIYAQIGRRSIALHNNEESIPSKGTDQFNEISGNEYELLTKSPIVKLPSTRPVEKFEVRQKWLGYVEDIGEETFTAHLTTLKGEGNEYTAEIYLEQLDPEDRELLQLGSYFYWSIGYLEAPSRKHVSFIRLRC
jgi:hypothetical protein